MEPLEEQNIRLVVTDLDETLLNNQQRITPYSEAVLKAVREKGIALCFASGRDERMMAAYVQQVNGCDYLVMNNGAVVMDKDRNVLHSRYIAREDTEKILNYLVEQEIPCLLQAKGAFYASEIGKPLTDRVKTSRQRSEEIGYPVEFRICTLEDAVTENALDMGEKIVTYETREEQRQAYREFIRTLPGVRCESTGYGLMGVFNKDVSKQAALEKIMANLGIQKSQVMVFGDYDNDLSMFACAGHKIAVGNAVPALKAVATAVTESNNEDGVARYLQEFFGISL